MSGTTDRNQFDDAVNQLQKYADAPRADFANLLGVNPDGKFFREVFPSKFIRESFIFLRKPLKMNFLAPKID